MLRKTVVALLVVAALGGSGYAASKTGTVVRKDAQAVGFTQSMDMGALNNFSVQAVYADGTPSSHTVSAGQYSSMTLTVNNWSALDGRAATATITLQDGKNTAATLIGAYVSIQGNAYIGGVAWSTGTTSTVTAANIAASLDTHPEYTALASSNVITVHAVASGTLANSWVILTSTPAALSVNGSTFTASATFNGGNAHGYFTLDSVTLTEGTEWNAVTSAAATAINIKAAINADTSLSAEVVASTPSDGVVLILSTAPGVNARPVSVSLVSALTPDYYTMVGGAASEIDIAGDLIHETAHGFSTGLAVLFSTVSGSTPPGGLTNNVTYYAIRQTADVYQLASSTTNAVAGTAINLTSLTGGGTYGAAPLALVAGSAGFKWQASNDNSTFTDLSVSSVTYSGSGSFLWDMGEFPYRWLRINFTAPTSGGIDLDVHLNGRE